MGETGAEAITKSPEPPGNKHRYGLATRLLGWSCFVVLVAVVIGLVWARLSAPHCPKAYSPATGPLPLPAGWNDGRLRACYQRWDTVDNLALALLGWGIVVEVPLVSIWLLSVARHRRSG